jgi:hypothetical protein
MDGSGHSTDYREDPNRAVYLLGEINQGLVEKPDESRVRDLQNEEG